MDAKVAIDLVKNFVGEYHSSFALVSATLEGDVWTITCDVGFLSEEVKEIKVDAKSGEILGYVDVSKNR